MATRHIRRKAQIGSISHGTLLSSDLLSAFSSELEYLAYRGNAKMVNDAERVVEAMNGDKPLRGRLAQEAADCGGIEELASEMVNDLQDKLNEYAPPFCYFGTNEGDGSDFGFWPDINALDELEQFDDGPPKDFYGEFKQVNDHGNVTIGVRFGNNHVKVLQSWV